MFQNKEIMRKYFLTAAMTFMLGAISLAQVGQTESKTEIQKPHDFEQLRDDLKLSDEQMDSIKVIKAAYREKEALLIEDASIADQQASIAALRQEERAAIMATLTSEQIEIMRKHSAQKKAHKMKGVKGSPESSEVHSSH